MWCSLVPSYAYSWPWHSDWIDLYPLQLVTWLWSLKHVSSLVTWWIVSRWSASSVGFRQSVISSPAPHSSTLHCVVFASYHIFQFPALHFEVAQPHSLSLCVYYPFLRGSFCKTGTGSLYFWAYGSFFTHHLFLCLNQKEAFVSGACLLYRSLTLYGLDCRTRVSTSQHPTCWLIGVPQVWSLVKMIQRTWEGVFMNTSGWLQRIHLRNSQMEDMHRAREEWRQGWVLLVPTFPASDGFTYSLKSVVLSFYGCAIAKTLLVKCLTIQFLSQSLSPPWQ